MITSLSSKPSFKSRIEYNNSIKEAFEWAKNNKENPDSAEFAKSLIAIQNDGKNNTTIAFIKEELDRNYSDFLDKKDIITLKTIVEKNGKYLMGIYAPNKEILNDKGHQIVRAVNQYVKEFKVHYAQEVHNYMTRYMDEAQKNLVKAQNQYNSAIETSLKWVEENLKTEKTK